MISNQSKISGVLLGVVVGDLLGEQVESTPNPGLIRKFKTNAKYTDDTEMTLITLQHLITFQTINPLALTLEYASNATFSRKYGGNMLKTLKKIKTEPENWASVYKEFLPDGSWGNGCLMRVAPIGLWNLNLNSDQNQLRQMLTDCLVGTHNHDEALQCSLEYCLILKYLFHNLEITASDLINQILLRNLNPRLTDKITLIQTHIVESTEVSNYTQLFQFINQTLIETGIRSSDTLGVVVATLVYNLKYQQWTPTQLLPVIVSFGGDTDTNASILGAMLGAKYGIDWIDVDWFNQIESKDQILTMFNEFTKIIENKLKD